MSPYTGTASFDGDSLTVEWVELDEKAYPAPLNSEILVANGQTVEPGSQLTGGQRNPHDILETQGIPAVRNYLVDEAQRVYRSQGVKVHDKHFEVIVRQMLSKVKIVSAGDTNLLIDDVVERREFEEINEEITQQSGTVAEAKPVLLGISRVALMSQSFLARASFQETERVLTEAALRGSVDKLNGLKENVIIGRMIPARLDKSPEGLEILGLPPTYGQEQLSSADLEIDFESALKAVAEDDDQAYPAADLAQFAAQPGSGTEIGFTGEDDYEPESEDLMSITQTFFASSETDEPTTVGFDDE